MKKDQQGDERFRLLVEGVKDYAIFMLDPEGRVVTWNAGAERIKGYRADEIIGQHFSRFYPPEPSSAAGPSTSCRWPRRKAGSRTRGGGSARTARGSGPTSSSPPCGTTTGTSVRLLEGHPRPDRAQAGRGRDAARERGAVPAAGRGGEGLRHLHARPRGPRRHAGTPGPSGSRATGPRRSSASTSPASTRRRPSTRGWPDHELRVAAGGRPVRGRGVAGPQGRLACSGPTSSSPPCTTARSSCAASRRSPAT